MPWQFPIFLSTPGQLDSWCQFHSKSDFTVSSRSFLFPFLISEVISQRNEQDRYRMLLQAIAVARAGQYLMEAGAPMRFFVVAVYLRADLTAERYVVTHTGPGRKVCRSAHPPCCFPHRESRYSLARKILPLLRQRVRSRSCVRCTTSWG
jgi:hypothetical protein